MRYSIEGEPLPVVICNLEQGEVMITESGAMSWMSPNMKMETTGGGIGKMFGRALSGESIFLNRYTAMNGNGMIAFASSFPGSIRAFDIVPGGIYYEEENFSCISCCCIQRGSVRVLSAENRERTFRRRGIYYAEAFRKWNRISGI